MHFKERLDKIKNAKNKKKRGTEVEIDGIMMKDIELGGQFESNPRIYGGIAIGKYERQALSLPPKFAIFSKVKPIECKAEVEKSFTKLRWKREFERQRGGNEVQGDIDGNTFYNSDEKNFDLTRMQPTDLPFNKRVFMPPCAEEETEAKIQLAKTKINAAIEEYTKKSKGSENINANIKRGIQILTEKVKRNEMICYPTDKSGRFSIDSPKNYIKSMRPHLQDAEEVNQVDYDNTEKLLNAHMSAWCLIMKGDDRITNNFQSINNMIPPIYGLRKDHKVFDDAIKGPPMRPVCGAVVASNYRISHFLSMILRPLIKESADVCESTEDLLSRIRECNQQENLDKCIVGSMDVEALYPSIDIKFAVEKCEQMLCESSIEFKHIDTNELGLFLSLTTTKQELETKNIYNYCPTRDGKGRAPTLVSSGTSKNVKKRWSGWTQSKHKPKNDSEIRRMVALALAKSLEVTLYNHIFCFENKLYRQTKGGAIGVGIAGDVANLFMVWWDHQLKMNLDDEGIKVRMYSRYVDDINIVCETTGKEVGEETADGRVMTYIKRIANKIHESIQVTIDYPSNHMNGRMPVLDLEQWIEEVEVEGTSKYQILHSHYMKNIASQNIVHKESALSMQTKISILVSDLVRVMRNVSVQCNGEERSKHVQHFIHRMQFSGYSQEDKVLVYKKAKKKGV